MRQNEYLVALPNNFLGAKTCKNEVTEKLLKSVPSHSYIVESDSFNYGITYADSFYVRTKFCITRNTPSSSKLLINAQVIFSQKPIFFIKNIIEKSCMNALDDYFREMINCLNVESERLLKHPNGSADDSANSSLSSSPSILSYSDKSNEITDMPSAPLATSKSTNDLSRSKSRERSASPLRLRHVRNKSLNDSVFALSSRHNLKFDEDTHQNGQLPHNHSKTNNINHNNSNAHHRQIKSTLCSKCKNNETTNVNKQNHMANHSTSNTSSTSVSTSNNTLKKKAKYFDTDIFLKFFFIIMIFLLILNGVLYIKLKDIENIAITIKRHPKYASSFN